VPNLSPMAMFFLDRTTFFRHLQDSSYAVQDLLTPFKAYCCHMGTAIKHPVPDRVKPSFAIFDIHPGTLTLSPERQSGKNYK